MANEIQVNVSLIVNKGSLQYSQVPGSLLFDMTGTTAAGGAAAASSSATAVAIDLNTLTATTVGYAYFRNTDATNTILIGTGTSSFVPFLELRPREVAVLRLASNGSGTTPTFRSTAGTPVLQYWIAAT